MHLICAVMSDEFLSFTASRGNDLTTPDPDTDFPGLKSGDRWCLCLARWAEALDAGVAPRIIISATHEEVLKYVPLDVLKQYAIDLS